MIQFKRGKTSTWRSQSTPLADGQPGYDKDRNKIKIGNGKDSWDNLPDASGLRMEEILVSEDDAQKQSRGLLSPLDLFKKIFLRSGKPIFTYGTEAPSKNTLGQVYLQHYDTAPETDYVVASGKDGIWEYLIYNSGKVHCWGVYKTDIAVQNKVGNGSIYTSIAIGQIKYPSHISFDSAPTETATIITAKNKVAWLASSTACSATTSGKYSIVSYDKHEQATFGIAFDIKGKIKK